MAIWMQQMCIHNLTQAQDPSQLRTIDPIAFITYKQTAHARETWNLCVARRHSFVTRGFVMFCLKFTFLNNSIRPTSH